MSVFFNCCVPQSIHYPLELSMLFPHILHFSVTLSLSWRIYCTPCIHAALNTDIWRCATCVQIYPLWTCNAATHCCHFKALMWLCVWGVSLDIYSYCETIGCGKGNTISWKFIIILHFGELLANLYEFKWSHLYFFVQSACSPMIDMFISFPASAASHGQHFW